MTLLDEFAASFIEDNERIKTYWASKEYKELKTTAHRLKGAAKMVACDMIASPLANIEAQANDLVIEAISLEQVQSKIEASIEEVNSTFERFTEEINQLRQTKERL
ncbi:Hpt domain-containing protein, partial [Vibrio coralliirubri]